MKKADEYFLKLFHNNLVGMILTDEQHIIVDVNNNLLQLTEFVREEMIGKTTPETKIISEAVVNDFWLEFEQNQILQNKEVSFVAKSGKIVYTLFSTEKIELDGRNFRLTTIIDITERKKSEKALAGIYERVTDGFVAFDKDWNYTYINRNAALMMNRDPEYMKGKNVWVEFPHLVGTDVQAAYFEAMEKQVTINLEQYFEPQDMWYLHMIYPSPDALSVFFKDINYRKKDEAKIADSELLFRTLIKTAPVGIFETDATGSTIFVNDTWLKYTGMKFEEAMGDGWMEAVHPTDREWLLKGWYSKTESREISTSEYRILDKDGNQRWVSGKAVPVKNMEGIITSYIGIITDITVSKTSELELLETTRQLKELSKHLQQVREDERKNIAREIHDELGQQLTGIKMDIMWLKKKLAQGDKDITFKFDDTLKLVSDTVTSIRRITTELRPSIIDDLGLNAAIEWLVKEFSTRMDVPVNYHNDFDDSQINSFVSIGIFRILQESLTNIAKHAKAKGVEISVNQQEEFIQLSIKDDGAGFSADQKQTNPAFGLMGIRERTDMLKGKFTLKSRPGKGTEIKVSIPVK